MKTVLLHKAYETLLWCLSDSLCCKDCCLHANVLTYLVTFFLVVCTGRIGRGLGRHGDVAAGRDQMSVTVGQDQGHVNADMFPGN